VFVGSDDGRVQALDLRDGQVIWSVVPGPDQPWISGNGRLISPHPIRTGLLVSGGIVYATAGLFPLEGTYLVALDGSDGRLRWRRQLGNVSPQGYLVDAGADLIVPNGRAEPSLRDAARAVANGEIWLIIAAGEITGWHVVESDPGGSAVHGRFLPVWLYPIPAAT
jgi:hypothetical protein